MLQMLFVAHPQGATRYVLQSRRIARYKVPAGTKVKVVGHTKRHISVIVNVMIRTKEGGVCGTLRFNVKPHLLSYQNPSRDGTNHLRHNNRYTLATEETTNPQRETQACRSR